MKEGLERRSDGLLYFHGLLSWANIYDTIDFEQFKNKEMETDVRFINQKEKLFVDATPDEDYPLRILKAYRQDCDTFISDSTSDKLEDIKNPIFRLMNEHQKQRAKILDEAIDKLNKKD